MVHLSLTQNSGKLNNFSVSVLTNFTHRPTQNLWIVSGNWSEQKPSKMMKFRRNLSVGMQSERHVGYATVMSEGLLIIIDKDKRYRLLWFNAFRCWATCWRFKPVVPWSLCNCTCFTSEWLAAALALYQFRSGLVGLICSCPRERGSDFHPDESARGCLRHSDLERSPRAACNDDLPMICWD